MLGKTHNPTERIFAKRVFVRELLAKLHKRNAARLPYTDATGGLALAPGGAGWRGSYLAARSMGS
jgi:hypothetical protein